MLVTRLARFMDREDGNILRFLSFFVQVLLSVQTFVPLCWDEFFLYTCTHDSQKLLYGTCQSERRLIAGTPRRCSRTLPCPEAIKVRGLIYSKDVRNLHALTLKLLMLVKSLFFFLKEMIIPACHMKKNMWIDLDG